MKNILVVVDCQNDFLTGSLKNDEAVKKIPNIVKKIRNNNWDGIFVTQDTHDENYLMTLEGKNLPVEHCIFLTEGWEIEDNIKAALNDAKLRNIPVSYISKYTFGSLELASNIVDFILYDLKDSDEVNIELVGFCTDICVVSNALILKANLENLASVSVDSSCCAGITPETHEAALTTMKMCQVKVN